MENRLALGVIQMKPFKSVIFDNVQRFKLPGLLPVMPPGPPKGLVMVAQACCCFAGFDLRTQVAPASWCKNFNIERMVPFRS